MTVQAVSNGKVQAKTSGYTRAKSVQTGFTQQLEFGYLVDENDRYWPISRYLEETLSAHFDPDGFKERGDEKLPFWKIDNGGAVYTKASKNPNACVYNATKKYIEAMSLGTFTLGDKDFFVDHPGVTGDGVDRANVLGVAHGLLIPWGLGISRVWVPKMSAVGDQEREFMTALGCNPMAILDAETSNEEFILQMELDPGSEVADFIRKSNRFEFSNYPRGPAVIMLSYSGTVAPKTNVVGQWANAGYGGIGHAEFIGPRDRINTTWHIAFSVDRLENIAYHNGSDLDRYATLDSFKEQIAAQDRIYRDLSPWACTVHGEKVSTLKKPVEKPVVVTYPSTGAGTAIVKHVAPATPTAREKELGKCPDCGQYVNEISGIVYCLTCNWYDDIEESDKSHECPFCTGSLLWGKCDTCEYDELEWIESSMFKCKIHGNNMLYFSPRGATSEVWVCPSCTEENPAYAEDFIAGRLSHRDIRESIHAVMANEKAEEDNGEPEDK